MTDIKVIIFDLDGVLVDSRPLHFHTFNAALQLIAGNKYIISPEEHEAKYDGRPTRVKLQILSDEKGLNSKLHEKIWQTKQQCTEETIKNEIHPNQNLKEMLQYLKNEGKYHLICASNSIDVTTRLMLESLGILTLFDKIYSCTDVTCPKPHPEMYIRAIYESGFSPIQVMICEDSPVGRKAAMESGAHVLCIQEPAHLTLDLIQQHIQYFENVNIFKQVCMTPWISTPNMNIVIPMAGQGSRFKEAGYKNVKPLIDVRGKPMINVVIRNLNIIGNYIFVCQKEHVNNYCLDIMFPLMLGDCTQKTHIVELEYKTQGAAESVLMASHLIDNDNPLLIANSDQFVEWDASAFLYKMQSKGVDGGIVTFHVSGDPKWSYAKVDSSGYVESVHEKNPVSCHGTVGIYYWKKGSDFVKFAKEMMSDDSKRVNGEFYVCPVFNNAIAAGKKIITWECQKMWGLGTPQDLKFFLDNFQKSV